MVNNNVNGGDGPNATDLVEVHGFHGLVHILHDGAHGLGELPMQALRVR